MPRTSVTDILLGSITLTEEQLERAQELSTQKGIHLEDVLLQQHLITDDDLLQAHSRHLGIEYS
jgi:hypothetical protein